MYAKFDRLEQLRENLRNLTECLGYRSITLLWQSLTAAKIYFERHWIPKEVPLIVDHPYILVDLDGMGLITTTQAAWLHSWISSTSQKVFFQYDLDGRHVASTKNCRIPGILPFCVKGNSVQNSVRPSRAFHLIALYPCHLSKCPKGWTPFEASTFACPIFPMSKRRIAHLPICNFQFGNEHDFIFKPQLCGRQAQGVVDHVCCYFASPRPSRPSRPSRPASTSPRPASTSFTSRVLHVPMSLTSPTSLTSTSPTSTSCEKRPCLFRSSFWGVILWDARQPITPIIAGIIANLGYTPLQIRILMNAHEIISGVFHLYTVNNQDPLLWKTGNKCLGSGFFSPHFAQKLFLYKIMGYTQACFSSQQQ